MAHRWGHEARSGGARLKAFGGIILRTWRVGRELPLYPITGVSRSCLTSKEYNLPGLLPPPSNALRRERDGSPVVQCSTLHLLDSRSSLSLCVSGEP